MPSVLVTGTSSGFGRAITTLQARRGWHVIATVLPGADTSSLLADLDEDRTRHLVDIVELDVTDFERVATVIPAAIAPLDTLDAVVNNAGIRIAGAFEDTPEDQIRRVFAVNTFGTFEVTRAVLPKMRAQRHGRILAVSSVGALAGLPGLAAYVGSKAAVEGWAEALAYEVAPYGIDVGLVEPQSFKTEVWSSGAVFVDAHGPYRALGEQITKGDAAAAQRAAGPEVVAGAVADLLQQPAIRLRTPVGPSARARALARGVVPAAAQRQILSRLTGTKAQPRARSGERPDTVVITGTSTGFGTEMVIEQAKQGSLVFATMRSLERSAPLQARITREALDDRVHILQLDVTDPASISRCVSDVSAITGGRLDALVNNAGVRLVGAFEDLDADRISAAFDTNVFGVFFTTQAFLPMLRAASGHIVTVTSSSSFSGLPTWSVYAATKFAVTGWADALQYEVGPFGVHVSLIAPGAFKTDIWREGTEVLLANSPYRAMVRHMAEADAKAARDGGDPLTVARAVSSTLSSKRPIFCRPVGAGSWARWAARGIVPDRVQQQIFTKLSGLSKIDPE